MSMVHASIDFLEPPSDQVRSEPAIVASIAKATLGERSVVDWDAMVGDDVLIRDKIEAVFPDFSGYNERIREPGGFQLPNSAQRRIWKTESGKANSRSSRVPRGGSGDLRRWRSHACHTAFARSVQHYHLRAR